MSNLGWAKSWNMQNHSLFGTRLIYFFSQRSYLSNWLSIALLLKPYLLLYNNNLLVFPWHLVKVKKYHTLNSSNMLLVLRKFVCAVHYFDRGELIIQTHFCKSTKAAVQPWYVTLCHERNKVSNSRFQQLSVFASVYNSVPKTVLNQIQLHNRYFIFTNI